LKIRKDQFFTISGYPFVRQGYDYDNTDNLTDITNEHTGRTIHYDVGAEHQVTAVKTRVGSDAWQNVVTNVGYHASGALKQYDFANGRTFRASFDDRHRPTDWANGPSLSVTLTYDEVGNVTGVTDYVVPGHGAGYGYDDLDRLTTVTGYGARSITYDDLGNQLTNGGNTFTYNGALQLQTRSGAPASGSYGYNGVGSTMNDPLGVTYGYTGLQAVKSATLNGQMTTYAYDGEGMRMFRKVGVNGEEHYFFHGPGSELLAEYRRVGDTFKVVREYISLGGRVVASVETVETGPPVVSGHPGSQSALVGVTVTFSASAAANPTPTVQWQQSTNGGASWSDITNATSPSLQVTAVLSSPARQYRAVFTNIYGTATSNAAILTALAWPAGDFTGDGKTDLVWQHPDTNAVLLWEMNGPTYVNSYTVSAGGTLWQVVGTGDFSGDGRPDLLWQHPDSGALLLWEMNGPTYVSSTEVTQGGTLWKVVSVADYTGDGKPDIVWQYPSTGAVLYWQMDGTAYVTGGYINPGGTLWQVVGSRDYSGDGQTDLLWQHPNTGELLLWRMSGVTYQSSAILNGGTYWQVVAVGDYTGDSQPDIVWQWPLAGPDYGKVLLWTMNNETYVSSQVMADGGTLWKVKAPQAPEPAPETFDEPTTVAPADADSEPRLVNPRDALPVPAYVTAAPRLERSTTVATAAMPAVAVITPTYVMTYYHTDWLGSVRALTDQNGTVIATHDYFPFGEDSAPLAGDPIRFTGEELDAETALHYFGARYYRQVDGRFTTVDPGYVSASLDDPQGWNAYAYARNNPLRFVDPTGADYVICLDGYDCTDPLPDEYFRWLQNNAGAGFALTPRAVYQIRNGVETKIGSVRYFDRVLAEFFGSIASQAEAGIREGLTEMAIGAVSIGVLNVARLAVEAIGVASSTAGIFGKVTNPGLKASLNELFRLGDTLSGGTARAIRHEMSTGQLVGGKSHILKGFERAKQLERIIAQENLTPQDRQIAESVLRDLRGALAGR
jgi:RHS repeat-associated protein